MAGVYDKVIKVLTRPAGEREIEELTALEPWFRKKSKLFASLSTGK